MTGLDEIQKVVNLIVASGFVGSVVFWLFKYKRMKEDLKAAKDAQTREEVERGKKSIQDHVNSMSDDELSRTSADIYDKLDKKS